jgi:hypothetical protein
MRWNGPQFHPGPHVEDYACDDAPMCMWVVEQHQGMEPPDVPEFTISVKWQQGDLHLYLKGQNSQAHGWRFTLRWTDPDTQSTRFATGFGYPTREAAQEAAEEKATKIAKAQQGEKVYKFKPEV